MKDRRKKYHAKVLLFGEHAVLKGSDALAIPFPKFSGQWIYTRYPEAAELLQMELPRFHHYLNEKSGTVPYFDVDTASFAHELLDGMYFRSNIPLGYGAGSSGALCAAIYDQFVNNPTQEPKALKKIFSLMESYFHGSSSGFDPMVSYLNQSIKISQGEMELLGATKGTEGLFLIDTGIPRSASQFISIFLGKCDDDNYERNIREELVPLTTQAIASYLKGDATSLFHQMHDISRYQYLHFKELIPSSMIPLWEKGLSSSYYKMKICGAGGGGFLLGMTKDFEKTRARFGEIELIRI